MKHTQVLFAQHLAELLVLHDKALALSPEQARLLAGFRRWRAQRMTQTYQDLKAQAGYQAAVDFLICDLFGAENLVQRGLDMQRAKSVMVRLLPDAMLNTAATALQLTALTVNLDLCITEQLSRLAIEPESMTSANYSDCLSEPENIALQRQQIQWVLDVGHGINAVIHKPLIATSLKMCRKPARLMGLGELQDYLERGFYAFKILPNANEFLQIFQQREHAMLENMVRQ